MNEFPRLKNPHFRCIFPKAMQRVQKKYIEKEVADSKLYIILFVSALYFGFD